MAEEVAYSAIIYHHARTQKGIIAREMRQVRCHGYSSRVNDRHNARRHMVAVPVHSIVARLRPEV